MDKAKRVVGAIVKQAIALNQIPPSYLEFMKQYMSPEAIQQQLEPYSVEEFYRSIGQPTPKEQMMNNFRGMLVGSADRFSKAHDKVKKYMPYVNEPLRMEGTLLGTGAIPKVPYTKDPMPVPKLDPSILGTLQNTAVQAIMRGGSNLAQRG